MLFSRRHFLTGAASAGVLGGIPASTQTLVRAKSTPNKAYDLYTSLAFAQAVVLNNPSDPVNWFTLSGVLANCTTEWHKSNRDATLRQIGQKVDASQITLDKLPVDDMANTVRTVDPGYPAADLKAAVASIDHRFIPKLYRVITKPGAGMTLVLKAATLHSARLGDHLDLAQPTSNRTRRPRAYLKRVQDDGFDLSFLDFAAVEESLISSIEVDGGGDFYSTPPGTICDPVTGCLGPGDQYIAPNLTGCQLDNVARWVFASAMLVVGVMATYTDTLEFVAEWQAVAKAGGIGAAAWSQVHNSLC